MAPYWESKRLDELSQQEWESLCDGCAKCCLHKFQDEDTGEIFYTSVRCRYLDEKRCRCSDYPNRSQLVPECIHLHAHEMGDYHWMPVTCAYRLRARGEPLPAWHHLVCGDRDRVHKLGISIRGRAISEELVHPDGLEEHIVNWVE